MVRFWDGAEDAVDLHQVPEIEALFGEAVEQLDDHIVVGVY